MTFVYMVHKDTKGTTYVPDVEDVIKSHEARGWKVADEPAQEVFVPRTVEPDADGWVALVHPKTGGMQRIPDSEDALAGALEAGWELPDSRTETGREADENAAASREAPAPASAEHGKPSTTADKKKE
jgi:hypothetical protein